MYEFINKKLAIFSLIFVSTVMLGLSVSNVTANCPNEGSKEVDDFLDMETETCGITFKTCETWSHWIDYHEIKEGGGAQCDTEVLEYGTYNEVYVSGGYCFNFDTPETPAWACIAPNEDYSIDWTDHQEFNCL